MKSKRSLIVSGVALALFVLAPIVSAAPAVDTSVLRGAVTTTGLITHLEALQVIAEQNGGTRSAGTPGYDASLAYVRGRLEGAGYKVTVQPFDYLFWSQGAAGMTRTARTYVLGTDFQLFQYSVDGTVDANVTAAGGIVLPPTSAPSSASGCAATDFTRFPIGNIALIQRGTCNFSVKVLNAQRAGASAAIIFNEGNPNIADRLGLIGGTLGAEVADGQGDDDLTIPAFDVTFAVGRELHALATTSGVRLQLMADTTLTPITTHNLLADTATGRTDRLVVLGAHLDSVAEGPGINDNGSGTATVLEIALQMAALGIKPTNAVRFAFWGGEEDGLIGSNFYVAQLDAREIKNHMLNLNLDMVGSPNFVRFVYDGDGSTFGVPGPNGSTVIEDVFNDYFRRQGLAFEATEFDGRSDYLAFINNGIPAGGLFTGAEGIKTAAQATTYGGTAGMAYDPCYHQECDDIKNLSSPALEQMGDASAHTLLTFAMTESAVNGTDKGKAKGLFKDKVDHRGPFAIE